MNPRDFLITDSISRKKLEHRRRKRVPAHIISFDDDDLADRVGSHMVSNSAPPTCLNSPAGSIGTAGSVNKFTVDKTDNNSASTKQCHNVSISIQMLHLLLILAVKYYKKYL